jgi:hypothetical protein
MQPASGMKRDERVEQRGARTGHPSSAQPDGKGGESVESYQVAELAEYQGVVSLRCTHAQDAEEILGKLGRLFPAWRVRPHDKYTAPTGDETGWLVDKCGGKHRYALWWLLRELGTRGWEPIAVAHEPSRESYAGPLYLFRKRIQD